MLHDLNKNFKRSDEIRDQLKTEGIILDVTTRNQDGEENIKK